MTETQLRAEVYNAISGIATTLWLAQPEVNNNNPFIVYKMLDIDTSYSFGIERSAENRIFQIDYYGSPEDIVTMDNNIDLIKTAMEAIDYRLVGGQAEFMDANINKVIKVTRWERWNV